MPTFGFNKLVRDKFPEIYASLGQTITSHYLTQSERRAALRDKIIEEAKELPTGEDAEKSVTVDELADLQQILDDIQDELGVTPEEVAKRQAEKFAQKGGFVTGLFVESITLKDGDKWIDYYPAQPEKYPKEDI